MLCNYLKVFDVLVVAEAGIVIAWHWGMRVLVSIWGERISPVFDVAGYFVVVDETSGREVKRRTVHVDTVNPVERVNAIRTLNVDVVICGAISKPLELMLAAHSIEVVLNVCGRYEDVLSAYLSRRRLDATFLLPGCGGRGRRLKGRRGNRNRRGCRR